MISRLSHFYDKLGWGILFLGIDSFFLHTNTVAWIDDSFSKILAIILKILLVVIGTYLIIKYATKKEDIINDQHILSVELARRKKHSKNIKKYHWIVLIAVCYLVYSYEIINIDLHGRIFPIILIILFWIALVIPSIYFWSKHYTKESTFKYLSKIQDKNGLINYFFDLKYSKEFKKISITISILFVTLIILLFLIPQLSGEETSIDTVYGLSMWFVIVLFVLFVAHLFNKRKIKKLKQYYLSVPNCNISAEGEDNEIVVKIDNRKLRIPVIFLPFSIEKCCGIINGTTCIENQITELDIEEEPDFESAKEEPDFESDESRYYLVSDKGSNTTLPIFIISIGLIALAGFIYSYLVWFIPIIYIKFLITAWFGFILGKMMDFILYLSKNRSFMQALVYGLIAAFVGWYFSWTVWFDLLFNSGELIEINHPKVPIDYVILTHSNLNTILYLIWHPITVFKMMSGLSETGYFDFFSYTPKGWMLYIIWFIEFGIILYFVIMKSWTRTFYPFSEKNKKWYKKQEVICDFIPDKLKFIQQLEKADYSLIFGFSIKPKDDDHSVLTLYYSVNDQFILSISNYKKIVTDKGKIKFKEDSFVNCIKIDNEAGEYISSLKTLKM